MSTIYTVSRVLSGSGSALINLAGMSTPVRHIPDSRPLVPSFAGQRPLTARGGRPPLDTSPCRLNQLSPSKPDAPTDCHPPVLPPIVFSMAADSFPDDLGKIMGINEVIIGLGFTVGPPIGSEEALPALPPLLPP